MPKMYFLAYLEATADAIFLGAHVQQRAPNQFLLPISIPDACGPRISLPPLNVTMSNPTPDIPKAAIGGMSAEAPLKGEDVMRAVNRPRS